MTSSASRVQPRAPRPRHLLFFDFAGLHKEFASQLRIGLACDAGPAGSDRLAFAPEKIYRHTCQH
jgi:hypothetical protein